MKNIRKKQIRNLFNDFFNIIYKGIWFFGIEGYGKYKEWYENGQLKINANYNEKGKLNGVYKKWYGNGNLFIYANYNKKGKLNGVYKRWYSNGNLIFEIKFEKNKLISINYVNFDYDKNLFQYWDEIKQKWISFYNKIKELYDNK